MSEVPSNLTIDQRVARLIKFALAKRGLTYRQFAEECGIPYRTLQNYLNNTAKIPVEFVGKCCDVLGFEADFLLFGGVDIERAAFKDAVVAALGSVLPSIDPRGDQVRLWSDSSSTAVSKEAEMAMAEAAALTIAARIRDEYIALRLESLRTSAAGGVSPQDAVREATVHRLLRG